MSNRTEGIVFGKGYIGNLISKKLNYSLTDLNPLDLEKLREFLDKKNPSILINAIGKTGNPNTSWCEEHKKETLMSNVWAAFNLCLESSERQIYFVHLSTGSIYEGDNNGEGFSEEDFPNFNRGYYNETKVMAENLIGDYPGLILRLEKPLNNKPHEKNLIDKLRRYPKLVDIPSSVTCIPHFLEVVEKLVEKERQGIYNVVNPGKISAAEIMKIYQKIIDPSHEFEIISKQELEGEIRGKRSFCYLNTDKLKKEGLELPEIHSATKKCLQEYKRFRKS